MNQETSIYSANEANADVKLLNVFDPKFTKRFEMRAKQLGKLLQQQCDRNLPRTYFSQGIIPSKERKE